MQLEQSPQRHPYLLVALSRLEGIKKQLLQSVGEANNAIDKLRGYAAELSRLADVNYDLFLELRSENARIADDKMTL
jgi:hypothetical protein